MQDTSEHIVAPKTYYVVFAILLGLLALTLLAAQIRHPFLNIVVALSIAVTKAVLIVLYFMHIRYSSSLISVIAVASLAWLLLLVGLTVSDFSTRGWDRSDGGQAESVGPDSLWSELVNATRVLKASRQAERKHAKPSALRQRFRTTASINRSPVFGWQIRKEARAWIRSKYSWSTW